MNEPYRKKLIEVALPLEAISNASRREKDKKTGTIRNVHKWFAPMPGPAWRALLFASLVDDPGDEEQRHKLIDLITELVPADGGPPPAEALGEARRQIAQANGGDLPTVIDPFCGGGSTLVEAQRLGLATVGSDLNPVATLITRVLTVLVPKAAGKGPFTVGVAEFANTAGGPLDGLIADVHQYAGRVYERVWNKIGHLYPAPAGGGTVVAWLWARTVTCDNPACRARTPLVGSFWLTKRTDARTWVEAIVLPDRSGVQFEVRSGPGEPPLRSVDRTGARCVVCQNLCSLRYVREEGRAGRLSVQLMAIAVDETTGRSYVTPTLADVRTADVERPEDAPDLAIPQKALGFRVQLYGMETYGDLFTNRQLVTLSAFAKAVSEIRAEVIADGGDDEYARSIVSILGLGVGKLARANSTQATWNVRSSGSSKAEPAFSRQALPMVWDFAEVNPFGASVGSWMGQIEATCKGLRALPQPASQGRVHACDARRVPSLVAAPGLVATDPPYFAQIGYADLSDFFYVWLRRALRDVHPDLFSTVATPKDEELIADPHRHAGDTDSATRFFIDGFTETFGGLRSVSRPDLPMLVVYAHRQEESADGGFAATAWDAMLTAISRAGLGIVGTWPVHATRAARQRSQKSNALASYIILVCRPRPVGAAIATRRDFLAALKAELPAAIRDLQHVNIAPVDLAQAAIGPGMALFSRYAKVVEVDGSAMTVRTALGRINAALDEILAEQEGDFDVDTRFAVAWFEQHGASEGEYGQADVLARAKNTSVSGLEDAGILDAPRGKVRLLARDELPRGWDPAADQRLSVWEVTQHLIRRLEAGGESDAADLLRRVGGLGETARELAYRLYSICERKGWAQEALGYNALVVAWPEIAQLAGSAVTVQETLEVSS
jgi:putative DNA methylase